MSCHGGVKQSGGFGLVFRENALGHLESGNYGIVPGSPKKSALVGRITHYDPEFRMPLDKDPLSKNEIDILKQWIKEGAHWEDHWAYIPPKKPNVPLLNTTWAQNEIDHFILEKIYAQHLNPSPTADPADLIRRLSLDLTGLPPSTRHIEQFINDSSIPNYAKIVDELLASPSYGEHLAAMWLDLARYADSKGYEKDAPRNIWEYRDWVIRAFNNDMPFDQFTIEQLAGDLLPNPTKDQLIATAMHRNTLNNTEGGTDNEEYRIAAVVDRVNTTWEVWQSTTMGCAQCHSHPYDPIKHEEYYSSFAFFNNTVDWDSNDDRPYLKALQSEDQADLDEIITFISDLTNQKEANQWERWILTGGEPVIRPLDFDEINNATYYNRGDQEYLKTTDQVSFSINNINANHLDRIYLRYHQNVKIPADIIITENDPKGKVIAKGKINKTEGFDYIPFRLKSNEDNLILCFTFYASDSSYEGFLDGIVLGEKLSAANINEADQIYDKIDRLLDAKFEYSTPIMLEKAAERGRTTHVFDRGNWLVKGKKVYSDIPQLFDTTQAVYGDRLDFANWLVSPNNPLTARVFVNRIWAYIFGIGIVSTVEDFGTLGEPPTHMELLDWLAIKFSGDWKWNIKRLVKEIVLSNTYRQSAFVSNSTLVIDPYNKWLARSPRMRLSAEEIRDQALAVSGLLSPKMYGPAVMPKQPDSVWSVVYSDDIWSTSEGEDAYRRALYTFFRRSSPYPSFITFDAGSREVCQSRRIVTNTPLQALVTLNDPVYLEAAQTIAKTTTLMEGNTDEKINYMFHRVIGKPISSEKRSTLKKLYNKTKKYYSEKPMEVRSLTKTNNIDLACFTIVANALMNLDEFLVKN